MIVFATIAAVSVGVIGVYFEMQEQEAERNPSSDDRERPHDLGERLVVTPTDQPAHLALDEGEMDRMPALAAALLEAGREGSTTIDDPVLIDAIWLQLDRIHDIQDRAPLVVTYQGASYALQMTGPDRPPA